MHWILWNELDFVTSIFLNWASTGAFLLFSHALMEELCSTSPKFYVQVLILKKIKCTFQLQNKMLAEALAPIGNLS